MDFSLSSSLVGSAVLNADKLSLDLQFAADKTLTARKGPTPAFTRGSNATVVGSNGLVRYAPNNSSLYSGQLVVGTGWSANATPSVTSIVDGLGPDGNNAYEIAEIANTGTHTLFNTGGTGTTGATSVVSGTTYTGSIFVKKVAGSVDWIQLSFSSAGFGSVQYTNFNISNGTIGNSSSSSPQIQDAGNGWYRCSISAVATSTTTTTSNLFLAFTNNTDTTSRLLSYAGNTANKVLAAMCQFEIGSTVNTYNPTTIAAFQGPRFDHDPVTLACKGLLIEESRTNMLVQSEDFTITQWAKTGVTITGNTTTAPDSLNTGDLLSEDTNSSVHAVQQTGYTLTASQSYTASVFAKAGSHTSFQISLSVTAFGTGLFANFVLTGGGSVGTSNGVTARIESFPNGWYRCSVTISSVTGGVGGSVAVVANNNNSSASRNVSYLGTGAQVVYIWGAQLEAGSFATSYIPTVSSSVVRSADVCSITGSDFTMFYNPLEGSFATSQIFNAPISYSIGQLVLDINDTTTNNRLRYFRNPTTGYAGFANTSNSSTNVSITNNSSVQPLVTNKYSAGFKLDDYAFYVNNSQSGTDQLGAIVVSPTTMTIGDASAGGSRQYLNGTIAAIRYFRKRLPNAKLQAFTV